MSAFFETWREIYQLPPGTRAGMYLATFVLRGYATLMAIGFGLMEADNQQTFAIVVCAGVLVDALRNLFAPEVKETPRYYSELPQKLHEGVVKTPSYRKIAWLNVYISGVTVLYILGFMIFGPQKETDPVPQIVRSLAFLENSAAHISPLMRHIDGDLITHNYPNRAMECSFVFMIGIWFTVINVLMWLGGVGRNMFYQGAIARIEKPELVLTKKIMRNMFFSIILVLLMYIIFNNAMTMDWKNSTPIIGYHLFNGNFSFWVFVLSLSFSYILMLAYWVFVIYCTFLSMKTYNRLPPNFLNHLEISEVINESN